MVPSRRERYDWRRFPDFSVVEMDMIGDTADAFWENPILFCDATHVWPKTLLQVWNHFMPGYLRVVPPGHWEPRHDRPRSG
jgi:hypothetical protein